jgi:endonuclease G
MRNFVLYCLITLTISFQFAYAGPIEDCKEYSKLGVPGNSGEILCREGYLLAHDSVRKTPVWVIEHLTAEKASGSLSRKDAFKADPNLAKGQRAELSDYKNSGYDKGHMAPSADMAWDEEAMAESFYLSNMVPQVGIGMNRGIWKDLEELVRKWAIARGSVYIFTGPIYEGETTGDIGKNKVAVPSQLYKIVYDESKAEAISFIMPNSKLSSSDIPKYITTIRDIEKRTGLDFLSELDEAAQDVIEMKKATTLWE